MSRITEIALAGKSYPLNFSTKAVRLLEQRFGDLDGMLTTMQSGKSAHELLDDVNYMLWVLIDQGVRYRRIVDGLELPGLTLEEIEVIVGIDDLQLLMTQLPASMVAGVAPTVELEPDPKNETATQD